MGKHDGIPHPYSYARASIGSFREAGAPCLAFETWESTMETLILTRTPEPRSDPCGRPGAPCLAFETWESTMESLILTRTPGPRSDPFGRPVPHVSPLRHGKARWKPSSLLVRQSLGRILAGGRVPHVSPLRHGKARWNPSSLLVRQGLDRILSGGRCPMSRL